MEKLVNALHYYLTCYYSLNAKCLTIFSYPNWFQFFVFFFLISSNWIFKLFIFLFLKKKKKNSSSLPPTFPLSLCLFISLLLFTLPLNFFYHSLFLIFQLFFSLILFCINLILFIPFNPYFFHTKTVSTFSLSQFLFSLIALI